MDINRLIVTCALLTLVSALSLLVLTGCLSGPDDDTRNRKGQALYVSSSSNCGGRRPCYTAIQDAVDAASQGDEVKVASGVYTTTASQVVTIKKSIRLVGGYRVDDWSAPRPEDQRTIVDAEQVLGRRGLWIDGREVPTITVRGLWVRYGSGQIPGGGGIYVAGGSVVLVDNVIEACTADTCGGGLFIADGSVHLTGNRVLGNAAKYGGGLYVDGGSVVLHRNTLMNNEAHPIGGALAIDGGLVRGANNVVAKNALAGAGVYLTGGHLTASHWTLVENGHYGVFASLGVDKVGGTASVSQCIIASTTAGVGGAGVEAQQTLFHLVEKPCALSAACVSSLYGDPKFVDTLNGDYHVASGSAAVDQGHSLEVTSDMDGDTRPTGTASDIGADEIALRRVHLPLVVRQSPLRRP